MAGAELAANPAARDRLRFDVTMVSAGMVAGIDALLEDYEARIAFPTEFIVPGETRTSAALELARTILRRAERRAVTLERADLVPGAAPAAVPQPPGGPAVGPCPGGRAGRSPPGHAGSRPRTNPLNDGSSAPDRTMEMHHR